MYKLSEVVLNQEKIRAGSKQSKATIKSRLLVLNARQY